MVNGDVATSLPFEGAQTPATHHEESKGNVGYGFAYVLLRITPIYLKDYCSLRHVETIKQHGQM